MAASSVGARGQSGFVAGCRRGAEGLDAGLVQARADKYSDDPCTDGGRTVGVRVDSGELRGTAVARWRAGRVVRLADKAAGLGTRGTPGALTARPRVPWSACLERVYCRQRACQLCAHVLWGLSLCSNLVQ